MTTNQDLASILRKMNETTPFPYLIEAAERIEAMPEPINKRGGEPTCPSCGALLPAIADSPAEGKPLTESERATLIAQHQALCKKLKAAEYLGHQGAVEEFAKQLVKVRRRLDRAGG